MLSEMQEFGKTIFISILSKLVQNRKTLIIDFDFINNNLHSVFGIKELPSEIKEKIKEEEFLKEFKLNEKNIKKLVVKIDRRSYLVSKTKIIFDENYKYNEETIRKVLEDLKKQYDFILIDTSSDTKYKEVTKILVKTCDKVICLVEGNLMIIRKAMKLLKENFEDKDKIKIIYNKKNPYTLPMEVLKIIFIKFKIIGKLNYDNNYNRIINKNVSKLYISQKIKNEFKQIIKKLLI